MENVFYENNNNWAFVIKQILKESYDKHKEPDLDMNNEDLNLNDVVEERNVSEEEMHLMLVPYQGTKWDFVAKTITKRMNTLLPTYISTKIAITGSNLSTCFQVKDKTKFEQIVYHGSSPETDYPKCYIGKTARRIS